MEKDKKVVVLDRSTALVIHENTEGNFLMSRHRNMSSCDDNGYVSSYTANELYTLSKRQAAGLMKKEPSSKIFQYILNKVLKKNGIEVWKLKGEADGVCRKILDDDNKLAQAALKERNAYLNQEIEKRRQEKERTWEQEKVAFSQKVFDYVKGFRTK